MLNLVVWSHGVYDEGVPMKTSLLHVKGPLIPTGSNHAKFGVSDVLSKVKSFTN